MPAAWKEACSHYGGVCDTTYIFLDVGTEGLWWREDGKWKERNRWRLRGGEACGHPAQRLVRSACCSVGACWKESCVGGGGHNCVVVFGRICSTLCLCLFAPLTLNWSRIDRLCEELFTLGNMQFHISNDDENKRVYGVFFEFFFFFCCAGKCKHGHTRAVM